MTGFFKVNLQLEEISSVPSAVSGAVILYADSASHRLYARNASGAYILGSMDNPMTNAGDLIVGGESGVPTRMGVGTANYALTVNSGGTGIGYTDGSAIPQVAQNTSDISDLQSSKQDVLTAGHLLKKILVNFIGFSAPNYKGLFLDSPSIPFIYVYP